MRTRNFLRSCRNGFVGRLPVYLLGAILSAGLAFSVNTYAVHDIGVFELDNGTKGANAIDQSSINNPDAGVPDDWAQNNYNAATMTKDLGNCADGVGSCGYVAGPSVNPMAPGGHAFRSVYIQDPNGSLGDGVFAGGGSKDDLDVKNWLWKSGATSSDKTDLLPVGAAAYLNGDLLIYTFGTLLAPNGDAAIGTWLLKQNIGLCGDGSPPGSPFGVVNDAGVCLAPALQPINLHKIGDVLVVSENTNGGRNVGMAVYQWVDEDDAGGVDTAAATAAKDACVADGHVVVNNTLCLIAQDANAACSAGLMNDKFCGTMNLGEVKGKDPKPGFPTESPDDWNYLAKGNSQPAAGPAEPAGTDGIQSNDFPPTTLFEAGFNFSKLFPTEVGCFNTFLMNTRASQSVDSVLEDVAIGKFPLCGISVDKTGPEKSKVGDDAVYTFTITNTGAITLYLDTVVDDVIGDLEVVAAAEIAAAGCASLAPNGSVGDSCTFNVSYTVQGDDPDPLVNTVTVHYNSASDLTGDDQTASDDHSVNLFDPSITMSKTGDELSKVGDDVDYVITLNNTSSTDTPDLECTITDALLGINANVTLASGASHVINKTYTVQAGDPDPLPNTAYASCSVSGFTNVLDDNASHSVQLFQPSIALDKTGDTLSKVGDDVDYVITLDNTSSSDTPALDCTITDTKLGISENVTLAYGESKVINATYTVQAGDPDPLENTAEASCTPSGFSNVLTASDDHSVQLFQASITLDKTGDTLSKVGDEVNYVITLDNTSSNDTPDLECTITDAKLGINENVTLASGANHVINAAYTVQAGDTAPVENTASASCSPIGFPNVVEASNGHSIDLFEPSVAVDKTADCDVAGVTAGADITYSYLITNTSSSNSPDLSLISVLDDKLGDLTGLASGVCSSLAPGDSCSFDVVYTTVVADVGTITNHVDVLYQTVTFENNVPADDDQECLVVPPEPAFVVIEKELLNSENSVFNYSATGLPEVSYMLTPLIGNLPLNTPPFVSPFAAPGAGNGFDTTDPEIVPIALVGDTENVSVTEELPLPPFINFVSLDCQAVVGTPVIGEVDRTANLTLGSGDIVFCRYVNEFNPGDEGCTPGFWKQDFHFGHWLPTGYLPSTLLSAVFNFGGLTDTPSPNDQTVAFFANSTMLEALSFQGGKGKMGAVEILLRAAVAAVLNSSHPDVQYAFTATDVIMDVNAALASNDRDTMLALASDLDQANNGVFNDNGGTESCPLSGQLYLP